MSVDSWIFDYEGFDPAQERLREALCTLGNGYVATRGAAPEACADDVHYPGTYLAGVYNRLATEIAGRSVENEDLVNLPNWLPLTFRIEGGAWFDLRSVELLDYQLELDLRRGVLLRSVRFRDGEGRLTGFSQRRFAHMTSPHLAGLEMALTAENWAGRLDVRAALDGRVVNAGVKRYEQLTQRHLEAIETGSTGPDGICLMARTTQSRIEVAEAARTRLAIEGRAADVERTLIEEPAYVAHQLSCHLDRAETATIDKLVALYSSRDRGISECGLAARQEIERVTCSFNDLLVSHALAWDQMWERCDLDIVDDERTQLILRLHIFHLLQTASPNTTDLDVGIPPRGWTGEAYRGHILWDELFIFPFLNFRLPEVTQSLLRYRYRRLPEARAAALQAGYCGAMYPWQSASNGREESQELHLNPQSGRWVPDSSRLQRHINAAIAYNVWQYYQVTYDTAFLYRFGAEMLLEIARFWACAATYNEQVGRYEIRNVMGPDEYHDAYPGAPAPGLNNNAYTNVMAVWCLWRALDVLEMLPEERRRELCRTLALEPPELDRWKDVSEKMRLVFHDDGIISQFEGYDDLAEFDWDSYRRRYGDIHRLDRILEAEGDTPNRYKLSKQADVLMLFYLFSADELRQIFDRLGYPLEYETIPKNVHYYLQRTSHGSTLSQLVHSWVLARSDRERSWHLFCQALESDVADVQGGTTPEGIHLGAMAGTVDLVQRAYTGIEAREDVLWFNPSLPEGLHGLTTRLHFRQHWLNIEVTHDRLRITTYQDAPSPIALGLREKIVYLEPGETREFKL